MTTADSVPPRRAAGQEDRRPAADYRTFMSSFPSGVGVVTAMDSQARPLGFTCSSMCSVALDPPTLLICAKSNSRTLLAVRGSGSFAVNLLHDRGHQAALAFASGPAANRFDQARWELSPVLGLPHLVDDAHSVAECVCVGYTEAADVTVVIGEIRSVTCGQDAPLLYGFRRFAAWGGRGEDLGSASEAGGSIEAALMVTALGAPVGPGWSEPDAVG